MIQDKARDIIRDLCREITAAPAALMLEDGVSYLLLEDDERLILGVV